MTDEAKFTELLKAEGRRIGFSLVGVAPAVTPGGFSRLREWLDTGYGGTMQYLESRFEAYEHPRHVLDGVRSVLVLIQGYRTDEPKRVEPGFGRVSRYAWGTDYHDLIHDRLRRLAEYARTQR